MIAAIDCCATVVMKRLLLPLMLAVSLVGTCDYILNKAIHFTQHMLFPPVDTLCIESVDRSQNFETSYPAGIGKYQMS